MSEDTNSNLTDDQKKEIATSRSYEYQLDWPIEIGDMDAITEVALKRFKGKQIKAVNKVKDEFDKVSKMIELSSGLTSIQVDEMDSTDITRIAEICSVFMDASQPKK
tara:strand:+ start:1552 stop:1872 length:321 start_codon:yes stop_codon:yes gene_type:complete